MILEGVWQYREVFNGGESSGYFVFNKEQKEVQGVLYAHEWMVDEDPFHYEETFVVQKTDKGLLFQGVDVKGIYDDTDFFLDEWLVVEEHADFVIANSMDGQGFNGVVTLQRIK